MIIIRRKFTNVEINKELISDPEIKHFEIVYRNKEGRFIYSNNKGNLTFMVRQLEKDDSDFILYTSTREFSKSEKVMFDVKNIGFVILDNTLSKVEDDELPILIELFEEHYKNNKFSMLNNCFYSFLAEATASHFIDDNLNMLLFTNNNDIFNRNAHRGIYHNHKKLWISDKQTNMLQKSTYNHAIDYASMNIELLGSDYKPITEYKQLQLGTKFKSYLRSCHKTMSISEIISEFKFMHSYGEDIKINVNFNSTYSCEVIIENLPVVKNDGTQKDYTSVKQLIEDYHTGECMIFEDFKNFSQLQMREMIELYPTLFAEILLQGWSLYDVEKEVVDDSVNKEEEDYFNNYDDEYQACKEEDIFDPAIGKTITIYVCYQCEEECFRNEVEEFIIRDNPVYLCNDCTSPPEGKELVKTNAGAF